MKNKHKIKQNYVKACYNFNLYSQKSRQLVKTEISAVM